MAFNRVKQWTTFARQWYLFDARWQDPIPAGRVLSKYLLGKNKPIFSIGSDCGDYVVVINSKEIALKNDKWANYTFFHHTRYARGATYTPAWKYHENDPTRIITECTKIAMPRKFYKNVVAHRLLVFPDDKVPENIMKNIMDQIAPQRMPPKRLDEFTQDEINQVPRLFEWPKEFVIDDLMGSNVTNQVTITP